MEQADSQIKPAYSRFHDLISPQARIEAAEQDEKQIIIGGRFQDARNPLLFQPIATTDAAWNDDPNILGLACADGISRPRPPIETTP